MDTLIGQQIGPYRIERYLAHGGMADVYLAHDVTLQRKAAFKVMRPAMAQEPALLARFQREAETAARLYHPNIVQVYTMGTLPTGQPYLVMQYVAGGTLADRLAQAQKHPLTAAEALGITRQIADALDVAHRAGIIHRDLKPSNILLRPDGTPVLADLGIAAVQTADTHLTRTGDFLGTPAYVSPEQASNQAVDGRADIYSLGIVLYEMLAGKAPFTGDSPLGVLHQHLYELPPPLEQQRPGLAPATYEVVAACLQKIPAARYPSAAHLAAAVDRALVAEGRLPPGGQSLPAQRPTYRLAYALSFVVLLLFGSLALYRALAGDLTRGGENPPPTTSVSQRVTLLPTPTLQDSLIPTAMPPPATSTNPPTPSPIPTHTSTPAPTDTATATTTAEPTATLTPLTGVLPLPTPGTASPTGRIVFTCFLDGTDDICAIDAAGGAPVRLATSQATDFYASPVRDGSRILFSSRRDGRFLLYSMNRDGSNLQPIGPTDLGHLYAPALSPDGRYLAFTAHLNDSQNIWVMELESGRLTQLTDTTGNNVDPVWSPDGRQLVFASDRDGDPSNFSHYVINADGTGLRRLFTGVPLTGGRSDWSPDGRWLAFYAGPRNGRNIYLVAIDGSVVYQLTNEGSNLAPSFSPDGEWITFTAYRTGEAEIFIMRPDGSDMRSLTSNEWADWQPRWGP